jgi:short subunit fatty acids transporter
MSTQSYMTVQNLAIGVVVIAIGVGGYYMLNAPDTRTDGQKIGSALDEVSTGANKAARQLQDRTPAEKIEDSAKDILNKPVKP